MIGSTLVHYKITAKLGEGGMGEVYRAEDTKLGRDVALKVLPPDMASDPNRLARFKREAKAVAALNHPNIVTIYSVEEEDATHFLTMELVEGKALEQSIPAAGLRLEELFDIAIPLADAISAAHERGIIHRDLKPTNIMMTDEGRVKVLDFGLAKLQPKQDENGKTRMPTEAMTHEGLVVGTIPYMSPEQIEGKTIDHRTDIFSLGIVLYEMATGQRPFSGESSPALMSAILRDTPQHVTELKDELPRHLGRVIGRCLEKDVRSRYQTARDVHNELKLLRREVESEASGGVAAGSEGVAAGVRSHMKVAAESTELSGAARARSEKLWVAVLPFANKSGDLELDSFAEGLSENILTGLSRFSYLSVVSRSSSFAYKERTADVRAVGDELGARYVMEGSLHKAGPTVRVHVKLVDTATGTHLWAETYDRDLTDTGMFALQDELTAKIVSTSADLYGVLPRSMSAVVKAKPPDTLSAYESVLRAFDYWNLITAEEHREVRACLERAVEAEPGYADAWATLSMTYGEEHKHAFNPRPDPLGRALSAARRAVDADTANHLALHALAQAHFFRKEFGAFRVAAERAISLNPQDGVTVAFMGILMAYAGDWEKGVEIAEGAMALNPHHPGWYGFVRFFNHYRKGAYQEALEVAQQINMPSYFYTHVALAAANGQLGREAGARAAVRELLEQFPDFPGRAREELGKWLPEELVESVIAGLRKAGLEVAPGG